MNKNISYLRSAKIEKAEINIFTIGIAGTINFPKGSAVVKKLAKEIEKTKKRKRRNIIFLWK